MDLEQFPEIFATGRPTSVIMWGLLILVTTLLALIFYRAGKRPLSFPPGPLSLPIIGSLLSLLPTPKVAFQRLHKKYGDICSFKVFHYWSVLITDPVLIRSTGSDAKFSDRPLGPFSIFTVRNKIIHGKEDQLGLISTSGDVWKHQRRFTLKSLKDRGFGRNGIEPIIQNELEELGDFFAKQENMKINVGNIFNRSIINVLWALVTGKRFSHEDERLQELVCKVNRMLQAFDPFKPAFNFPIIRKLFPNLEIFKKVDGSMRDVLRFVEDQLEIHTEENKDFDDSGSYLGHYLQEVKEYKEAGKHTLLNTHNLKANVADLFLGGSETTATTLWHGVYLLVTNPKVQQTMQEELDRVVGQGNIPTLQHFDSLPYTTATVYEIQRTADIFPLSVPHEVTQDVDVGGYRLPKGTCVFYNLSAAHKNPKYWKHPDRFYPEHFLTHEGKPYKPEAFLPFGYGKRICLGESLVRLQLFLLFASLFHRFSWKLSEDPVTWEDAAVMTRPPNFSVYVTERDRASAEARMSKSA